MQEIVITLLSSGSFFSLITWVFTRKSTQKTERIAAKKSELDNTELAVKIWRDLAQDLRAEIKDLKEEVHELREELKKHK